MIRAWAGAIWRSRWGLVVSVASYVVLIALYTYTPSTHEPGSDGFYTWLFTRSLVYDHDFDFTNDYELCGDAGHKNVLRGTSHPDNPFYVGPTIVWAPILWTLKHVSHLPPSAPPDEVGACRGRLVANTLGVGPLLAALTILIMARLGRRVTTDAPAALAAGLLGMCTSLPAYAAIMPSYAHVHDTFWVAVLMLASVRAAERPLSVWRWLLVGIAGALALLQRPVSVVFLLVPTTLATAALWKQWARLAIAYTLTGGVAFVLGAIPQMLLYRYLYGRLLATPHGHFYMQYGHAHPWLVLFAPHGGLFFAAPVTWLAVIGAVIGLRRREHRLIIAAIVVASAATIWISSAALDWHGSGTFGARRLTSLLPLFAIPTCLAIARLRLWFEKKPARARMALGLAVLVPMAFTVLGEVRGLADGRVTTEAGMSQGQLYGVGRQVAWELVDDHVGDLAIWPAELVFWARYGLSPRAFRDATEPLYLRNNRTLDWESNEMDLRDGQHANLLTGFVTDKDGMRLAAHRATIVFAAQWPFATDLTIHAQARSPTMLHVGRGTLFGTRWFGDIGLLAGADADAHLVIPPGGFDSGIMEIVIECDDLAANVVLQSIKIEDATTYPSPL